MIIGLLRQALVRELEQDGTAVAVAVVHDLFDRLVGEPPDD